MKKLVESELRKAARIEADDLSKRLRTHDDLVSATSKLEESLGTCQKEIENLEEDADPDDSTAVARLAHLREQLALRTRRVERNQNGAITESERGFRDVSQALLVFNGFGSRELADMVAEIAKAIAPYCESPEQARDFARTLPVAKQLALFYDLPNRQHPGIDVARHLQKWLEAIASGGSPFQRPK